MLDTFKEVIHRVMEYTGDDYYHVIRQMSFHDIVEKYYEAENYQELMELHADYDSSIGKESDIDEEDYDLIIDFIMKLRMNPMNAFQMCEEVKEAMYECDPLDYSAFYNEEDMY